jgi:hypothetical protein
MLGCVARIKLKIITQKLVGCHLEEVGNLSNLRTCIPANR